MSPRIALVALLALALGCAGTPEPPPEHMVVDFLDSATFDSKLSGALDTGAPFVSIALVSPMSANAVPERLDRWLSALEEHGNQLTLEPDPDLPTERGAAADAALALVKRVYDRIRENRLYRPTRSYDGVVYYSPQGDGITRVVFFRKDAGDSY